MSKEVIKEASIKTLKQIEQKNNKDLSSKFNMMSNYKYIE